jgi:hypothetical protein
VCGSGWGCWIRTSGKRNQNPLPYQTWRTPKSGGTSGTRTRTLSRAKDFKSPSSTVPTWSHLSFFVLDPYDLIITHAARPRTGKGLSGCAKRDLNPHALRHELLRLACLPFHHPRNVVGDAGFEPTTSCAQGKRSTRLS